MLFMVGTGLAPDDISLRALELCKRRGIDLFAENYTSNATPEYIRTISERTGKRITMLGREEMEEGMAQLVKSAAVKDIVVLVGGDPLIATTHKIAYMEARKHGVMVAVLHSASVLSAAMGESGLDFYRFGQVCTIPRWSEHYKPVSFYETIEKNMKGNLHSLLLLDYNQKSQSSIQPSYAAGILEGAEKSYGKGIIGDGTKLIVLHNLSIEGESKLYLGFRSVKRLEFGSGPTVFILPAKLSDIEQGVVSAVFGD